MSESVIVVSVAESIGTGVSVVGGGLLAAGRVVDCRLAVAAVHPHQYVVPDWVLPL